MTPYAATLHHPAGLAFDGLAEQYDDTFTHSLIGRAQRDAVWSAASQTFRRGNHILELNCGTGEDALFLVRLGASVIACDASEKMIAVANRRRLREAVGSSVRFEVLPSEQIEAASLFGPFDGIFSNFSGLNCVCDVAEVARQLATVVLPGSPALLCFSTRLCLWETLWFLWRREAGRAIRRWKGRVTVALGRLAVEVHYPTVRRLRRLFSPYFILRSWRGVGIAVPPSYLEPFVQRHPGLLRQLCAIDQVICSWPVLRSVGDHVLLTFERTSS
jgi:SAM-dependent methyltransferase